jgi:prepilin-type N-terminal cleavage/methylation domain-containing protein
MNVPLVYNDSRCALHKAQARGFTLIEILLSITLLSIVLGVVYTSFFTAERAIIRFNGVNLKYHEMRTALDIMRREIEGAFLKKLDLSHTPDVIKPVFLIEDRDVFGKTTSRLHYTTFAYKGGGTQFISYSVREKNGILNLIKTVSSPFTPSGTSTSTRKEKYVSEIIEDIKGFTVETLFKNKWVKTWDTEQTGKLPYIIRLSLEFDDKGSKITLREFARPHVGRNL